MLFASGRCAPSRHWSETLHHLDDAGLLADVRLLAGTSSAMLEDIEVVNMFLPALRADYIAIEAYRCAPGVAVASPVTVLAGDADPKVTVAEAFDWARHTTGKFALQTFAGGHIEHSDAVIALISRTGV